MRRARRQRAAPAARNSRASVACRDIEPARNGRTRDERVERSRDMPELAEADEIARLVEADEVAHPREDRDVGDRVRIAHHPVAVREMRVEHAEQPLRFGDVTVARTLVLVVAAREFMEEADLAEHRTDAAHLEHHPLDRLVAARQILRDQLARLVREIDQDRPRFEQRQRPAVGTVRVDDRRNLVVRIQRQEFGRQLVVRVEAHEVRLVRQAGLLEHDRHLDAVRRRQRIKLETVGMLGRPFFRDREGGQIGHEGSLVNVKNPRSAGSPRDTARGQDGSADGATARAGTRGAPKTPTVADPRDRCRPRRYVPRAAAVYASCHGAMHACAGVAAPDAALAEADAPVTPCAARR
ncbi:hypothetical protein BLAT2472_10893 [Burkholderia latens]